MVEASSKRERLVMNCKGPWEGYWRQAKKHAKRRLALTSRPLSPSRLPLRARFHRERERETTGYEADAYMYQLILKSTNGVTCIDSLLQLLVDQPRSQGCLSCFAKEPWSLVPAGTWLSTSGSQKRGGGGWRVNNYYYDKSYSVG